ncbi:hypothetical protein B0H10DRAFT_1956895 [Mycena sp. CBHHK59/15]|nr:hypothetical protein B0H10DRAFT_1956895 [Mycena sp. CBHHK59/15]
MLRIFSPTGRIIERELLLKMRGRNGELVTVRMKSCVEWEAMEGEESGEQSQQTRVQIFFSGEDPHSRAKRVQTNKTVKNQSVPLRPQNNVMKNKWRDWAFKLAEKSAVGSHINSEKTQDPQPGKLSMNTEEMAVAPKGDFPKVAAGRPLIQRAMVQRCVAVRDGCGT